MLFERQRLLLTLLHELQAEMDALKRLQAEAAAELDALLKPAWDIMRKEKGREGKAEG